MKKVALIIFDRFEEIEAITPIDILRRAGADVKILTLGNSLNVQGRSSIEIKADAFFSDSMDETFDAVVLSGGPGTYDVANNTSLLNFLKKHNSLGKLVAAICAAPIVLKNAGVLDGKTCTGHTSVMDTLGKNAICEAVVTDSNVITSRGAGTALVFALKIVEELFGKEKSLIVADSICLSK